MTGSPRVLSGQVKPEMGPLRSVEHMPLEFQGEIWWKGCVRKGGDDVASNTHGEKRKEEKQNGGQFSLLLSGLRRPNNV